jgi:diguanylate cyclase (GGDEF)-like protein/PAS domain S-box-containing protein
MDILNQRKQTGDDFLQGNQFAQATIDALSAHVCVLDEKGIIVSVNRIWREFAEANPPLIQDYGLGANYLEICENAANERCGDALTAAKAIRMVMSGEESHVSFEYPCHSPNEKRWFMVNITRFETQNLVYVVVAHENITARKLTEEALRESEERHRILFVNSPDSYLIIVDGIFVDCNRATEFMMRGDRSQIVGQPPEALSPEYQPDGKRSVDAAKEKINYALQTGMATFEWVHRRIDGTEFSVEVSIAVMMLNGQPALFTTWRDITERKRLQEELQLQATTDELTGVSNRRHFISLAQNELKRIARFKHDLALILIDVDHFKQINDTYGHTTGDQVLKTFTRICRENIRVIDVFARFGGDEFVLLLPETNCEQAYAVVERIRQILEKLVMEIAGQLVVITISSGITCTQGGAASLDVLLREADQALYQAKNAGRNCVKVQRVLP